MTAENEASETPIDKLYREIGELIPGSSLEAALYHADEAWGKLERENAALRAALALAQGDAERWREHAEVMKVARMKGALWVTLRMEPEACQHEQVWTSEFVIGTDEMANGVLRNRIIGIKVQSKAEELFAAIDAGRAKEKEGNRNA